MPADAALIDGLPRARCLAHCPPRAWHGQAPASIPGVGSAVEESAEKPEMPKMPGSAIKRAGNTPCVVAQCSRTRKTIRGSSPRSNRWCVTPRPITSRSPKPVGSAGNADNPLRLHLVSETTAIDRLGASPAIESLAETAGTAQTRTSPQILHESQAQCSVREPAQTAETLPGAAAGRKDVPAAALWTGSSG